MSEEGMIGLNGLGFGLVLSTLLLHFAGIANIANYVGGLVGMVLFIVSFRRGFPWRKRD